LGTQVDAGTFNKRETREKKVRGGTNATHTEAAICTTLLEAVLGED